MQFNVTIPASPLTKVPALAARAEALGIPALWAAETAHNPFLPLTLAAPATHHLQLGTGIAVAFARSPMVTAQIAWDLTALSEGRFVLGLGTQVAAHIRKRFGLDWQPPVSRLHEYIEALRAIWANWQTGQPLNYRGRHYTFTLMPSFFAPPPLPHPEIPVYIAGVNAQMCRLAGELCQGFHVHPFHTARYLREFIRPNIELGAQTAGRSPGDIALTAMVFVVTGHNQNERQQRAAAVKAQLAFYASTPSYAAVMRLHGWEDLHQRLAGMARRGEWQQMGSLISDDVLAEFAVVAPPDELAHAVRSRYDGLIDRIGYYLPFNDDPAFASIWQHAAAIFAG